MEKKSINIHDIPKNASIPQRDPTNFELFRNWLWDLNEMYDNLKEPKRFLYFMVFLIPTSAMIGVGGWYALISMLAVGIVGAVRGLYHVRDR